MIDRADVLAARVRIAGIVRRTPLLRADVLGGSLWLKCEFLQHTGVFKTRGAFNRLLVARARGELDPSVGVVVASGGNAGLANAYAAAALGVRATVFVPVTAPPVKVQRIREYGATVCQRQPPDTDPRIVAVEPRGCTPAPGERVAVVICGANTDVRTLEPVRAHPPMSGQISSAM